MSVIQKSLRPMRIIALPLARPALLNGNHSPIGKLGLANPSLTYYQFQLTAPREKTEEEEEGRTQNLVSWVTTKAADAWAGFGKAPQGNWKLRVFQYGERLVDRIDFEELALHSIDPSLGPSLTHPDIGGRKRKKLSEEEEKNKGQNRVAIPLIYAPSTYLTAIPSTTPHPSLTQLQALLALRTPRHRKGFYTWMLIAPFTAPFMVIPIVPNLPFFFCVWRSWAHYKAYRASQYLEALVEHGAIVPQASKELDQLYAEYHPSRESFSASASSASSTSNDAASEAPAASQELLLTPSAIPPLLTLFGLKKSASVEIYRALEQARLRVGGALPNAKAKSS